MAFHLLGGWLLVVGLALTLTGLGIPPHTCHALECFREHTNATGTFLNETNICKPRVKRCMAITVLSGGTLYFRQKLCLGLGQAWLDCVRKKVEAAGGKAIDNCLTGQGRLGPMEQECVNETRGTARDDFEEYDEEDARATTTTTREFTLCTCEEDLCNKKCSCTANTCVCTPPPRPPTTATPTPPTTKVTTEPESLEVAHASTLSTGRVLAVTLGTLAILLIRNP